uniref:Pentatricopeptide repeat-containing protein n=1 Tax=Kalanchoe fedtschenkoi TaxID=63787 RepID=A0A7N0U503_KALFE
MASAVIRTANLRLHSLAAATHYGAAQNILVCLNNQQSSNDCIISLCKQNYLREAVRAFNLLVTKTSFQVQLGTYVHLISACSSLKSLEDGQKIHRHMLSAHRQLDMIVHNHLLNMYGKCGSPNDARKTFDGMNERNLVSWTSMIAGYSQNGEDRNAIRLYNQMRESGIMPDQFTFGSVIKACSGLQDVFLGRQIQAQVIKSSYGSHPIPQNALVTMYTKCDQVSSAHAIFTCIANKDLVSWGSIIAALSQLGCELESLEHFKIMIDEGLHQPNEFIFGSAFSACSTLLQPEYGRQLHGLSVKHGLKGNSFVGCSLCDMYAKSGFLDSAEVAFYQIKKPDLVSWNAVIAGFAYGGYGDEALSFFSQMRHRGLVPDEITIRSLLCAFSCPSTLRQGFQVHAYTITAGFDMDIPVRNTLLTMYSKSSNMDDAFQIFDEVRSTADMVTWNALLTACLQHKLIAEVFKFFRLMLDSLIKPDYITFASVFVACADTASIEVGFQVHSYIIKFGLGADVSVINGLIDLYAKCGSLTNARYLFDNMESPDVVSWSSLIIGHAQFGFGQEALKLFEKMKASGITPNHVTFVGVLTACSHVGLIEEGLLLYRNMNAEYGLKPTKEHCSCVIDLLARAGCLHEAEEYIYKMAYEPDVVVWKTLLAACKTCGNLEIGKRAAENIMKLDPSNSTAHVLLSHIYASKGKWEDVARVRRSMKKTGVLKVPGQSWIEIQNKTHIFNADGTLHPEGEDIYKLLRELWSQALDDDNDPLQMHGC